MKGKSKTGRKEARKKAVKAAALKVRYQFSNFFFIFYSTVLIWF